MDYDGEFDTYASANGDTFSPEDQVASLLGDNQNMPEVQSRVADCRASYLNQLQMLLMGYHEDFLAVGKKMRDVCTVIEDLKEATRQGRTAIGDVSSWSLLSGADDNIRGGGGGDDDYDNDETNYGRMDGFCLGDPWQEGCRGSSSAATSATIHPILPITFLAHVTRHDSLRRAAHDPQGQCNAAISSVRQTQRLLDSAAERVQRRIHNHRQVLAMREIEQLAEGAADKITSGAPALALLRSATLDSFQREGWNEHPLALGDLEPRWRLLAEGGRLAAASSLMLRSHSAIVSDFSDSFAHSAVDVRSSTMRLSCTISAVVQHAGQMRRTACGEFDLGALQWWAHNRVQQAAADIFASNVERRKHTAPSAEAAVGAAAFRASAVASAADAVAMDISIALTFLPCEEETCSPVAHSLLRVIQPAQLQLLWEQVQAAVTCDFNFAAVDVAHGEDAVLGALGGASELPRMSALRCVSPRLPGVIQHRGLSALLNSSDEWREVCDQRANAAGATLNGELLLAAYVSEASNRMWDHLANLLSFRALVRTAVTETQYELQAHQQQLLQQQQHQNLFPSAAPTHHHHHHHPSSSASMHDATEMIDYYFTASPDWFAQIDLACTYLLSSYITALLEYRSAMEEETKRIALREIGKMLDAEQARKDRRNNAFSSNENEDGPAALRSFRPELFISSVDAAVASALSAVLSATYVAGLLLPISFPRFSADANDNNNDNNDGHDNNNNNNSSDGAATFCSTVSTGFAREAESRILRFVLDAVYYRAPTTLHKYFSPNDMRLRADGGGCIDLGGTTPAERAALFILSPFVSAQRGAGVLEWSADEKFAEATLVALVTHKLALLAIHASKVGGPAAAALFAAAMAVFLCDEEAFLSAECWNVVKQRSPVLRKLLSAASSQFVQNAIPKAVVAALYVLHPALCSSSSTTTTTTYSVSSSGGNNNDTSSGVLELVLPTLAKAGLTHDALLEELRRVCSGATIPSPPSSSHDDKQQQRDSEEFNRIRAAVLRKGNNIKKPASPTTSDPKKREGNTSNNKSVFGSLSSSSSPPSVQIDTLLRQVATESTRDFALERIPPCCWASLALLRTVVADSCGINAAAGSSTAASPAASTAAGRGPSMGTPGRRYVNF